MVDPAESRRTVLVTDGERGSALSIVRSLGRAGYEVVVISADAAAPAFVSRYCSRHEACPSPQLDPQGFVAAVLRLVKKWSVDLVIPVTEDTVIPLSKARAQFEGHTCLAIAEAAALAVALDKNKTLKLAQQLAIPVPLSRYVRTPAQARTALGALRWPVVLKPESSRAQWDSASSFEECKISYASSIEEVLDRLHCANGRYGFVLQEYCGGRGLGIELLAKDGIVLSAFQHVRLAEVPITGGASAVREGVALDPQLLEYSARLVARLGWTGLAMIEFRGEGGAARLMEMNGRVWGSLPLAVQSGMDFPAQLAALMLDMHPDSTCSTQLDQNYRLGHRAYNPDLLMVWFGSVLRGKSAVVATPSRSKVFWLLRQLRGATSDYADAQDPAPARGTSARLLRKLASKVTAVSRDL